jgi:hypothetical protein
MCLVWITVLEALCCADVTMQTTVLVTSKVFQVVQTHPAKILVNRSDIVSTCLQQKSGKISHLDRKQTSGTFLTTKKSQNAQCRDIKNEREKSQLYYSVLRQ